MGGRRQPLLHGARLAMPCQPMHDGCMDGHFQAALAGRICIARAVQSRLGGGSVWLPVRLHGAHAKKPHWRLQVPGHAVTLACSWGKTRAKDMAAAPEGAMATQQVSCHASPSAVWTLSFTHAGILVARYVKPGICQTWNMSNLESALALLSLPARRALQTATVPSRPHSSSFRQRLQVLQPLAPARPGLLQPQTGVHGARRTPLPAAAWTSVPTLARHGWALRRSSRAFARTARDQARGIRRGSRGCPRRWCREMSSQPGARVISHSSQRTVQLFAQHVVP